MAGAPEKIIKNWRAFAPEDTIVLGGDISWGINLAEERRFALIDQACYHFEATTIPVETSKMQRFLMKRIYYH
ncbi:MAG: hypothetical protein ACLT4C_08155 [Butyricicoccus sp.]